MICSLILGGTRGLGRELAIGSRERGIEPIIVGRSARTLQDDHVLSDMKSIAYDFTTPEGRPELVHSVSNLVNTDDIQYIFWVAGVHLQGQIIRQLPSEIENVFRTVVLGPLLAIRSLHNWRTKPYHLITVASTTSWKVRPDETVYGAAKAAQAQAARNLHQEMRRDFPGSLSTLVHPGGMDTGFLGDRAGAAGNLMSPRTVANIIWDKVRNQKPTEDFAEWQIFREPDGSPRVEFGARLPE